MHTQTRIKTSELRIRCKYGQNKLYELGYESMRPVHRGDNPNKETLTDIPYVSHHHYPSQNNLSCPRQIRHTQTLNYTRGPSYEEIILVALFERNIGRMITPDRYVEGIIETMKPS